MKKIVCILFFVALTVVACTERQKPQTTPWGTPFDEDVEVNNVDVSRSTFSLDDIIAGGEMIMLTLSGPDNYYDYRGRGLGTAYMLCEKLAQKLGVSLRVEICKDSAEVYARLEKGEGDIAATYTPKDSVFKYRASDEALSDTIKHWYNRDFIAQVEREQSFLLSTRSVQRRVYSPMLNRAGGVISRYDHLFRRYAPTARWDWRLIAAQCYQESTFDPKAKSWAGASGLMQIMPKTAAHLGLPMAQIFDPEQNIAAATRYIAELDRMFRDIPSRNERYAFVLACYNGGYFHIRDAMALAEKYGKNPTSLG